jgi:hypothetical protein
VTGEPATLGREALLFGALRNKVLDLADIERYGVESYGDADYVSVYGLRPAEWYAAGVRLLGRTAVECTRDDLADGIAIDIAEVVRGSPGGAEGAGVVVVDPFAGSGNTLYRILRRLPEARGVGFELDAGVFGLTRRNLLALGAPIDILNVDYAAGLDAVEVVAGRLIVVFVAPPWGDALDPVAGLDLRRTLPPVATIVDRLIDRFPQNRLLVAIQVYESVDAASVAEVESRFDWSKLRTYELNAPGQNHGILLGTRGWIP